MQNSSSHGESHHSRWLLNLYRLMTVPSLILLSKNGYAFTDRYDLAMSKNNKYGSKEDLRDALKSPSQARYSSNC